MTNREPPASPDRPKGLPIGVWLALGYALVIGAFAMAIAVSLRSTQSATADLAKMRQQFEPLSRSVRELGDGLATFDRGVLAYLRADTRNNRAAAMASAERLSAAANRTAEVGGAAASLSADQLLQRIADHEAEGFRLLDMQDERRRSIVALEVAFTALDRRIKGAGGGGVVVGNSLMARPSMAELASALEAARFDASSELARGGTNRWAYQRRNTTTPLVRDPQCRILGLTRPQLAGDADGGFRPGGYAAASGPETRFGNRGAAGVVRGRR